jgi:hypothetical protein
MAVKITQNGIDTVQNGVVSSSKIIDNSVSTNDLPAGTVLQVVSTLYTGRTSFSSTTSDVALPGGYLAITPKGTNSKFLITVRYHLEAGAHQDVVYNIQRNGTRINLGGLTAAWSGLGMAGQSYAVASSDTNSTPEVLFFETLDTTGSTAGVAIGYQLVASGDSTRTIWVNRVAGSDGTGGYENSTSEIIITEIKG